MAKKQFKAESKKLLDMMINSIYTHKEIFLRELISNASDAIDKLYFRSLTDNSVGLNRSDFKIDISTDKEKRQLIIEDNGIGMTAEELEANLGTIAKSGSLGFKKENETPEDVDIIGQFGVGFYSAFMVAEKVEVLSKAFGSEQANLWTSTGASGYTVTPAEKESFGTKITLTIKEDTEQDRFSEYLESYRISEIVKKYSDYIKYPIKMDMESSRLKEGSDSEYESYTENTTLNSMTPIWKKQKSEITGEQYNEFYKEKFFDYSDPLKAIHFKVEGQATYSALLYIPENAPYNYYSKDFEKGLQLYSNGVMIMDKCSDLLPDYFNFVKGLVDSEDLSLNISREMLQHDRQLKIIEKSIEKKVKNELAKMLENDRDNYEKFFKAFGLQLKFGIYNSYGANKETLQDLIIFKSAMSDKPITLKEYVQSMPEGQKHIYYACGETADKIGMMPQVDAVKEKGYNILFFTDDVDEFAIQMLREYDSKEFKNVCANDLDLDTEEEKESLKKENEQYKELFDAMKEQIGDGIGGVRFTSRLKNHPVCLTSEGAVSAEMEKVLNSMPGSNGAVKANLFLEINKDSALANKVKSIDPKDTEQVKKTAAVLYGSARLIEGMSLESPVEYTDLVCELLAGE